jgi:hypothetical protein
MVRDGRRVLEWGHARQLIEFAPPRRSLSLMNGRNKAARAFVICGSVVLFAGAALHTFASASSVFPVLNASNLNPALQAAFRVVVLSLGWHWLIISIVALLAGVTETRLRKLLVLICGLVCCLKRELVPA